MVLIDASTRLSHVCLLSTRNIVFTRLLAQIIRLRTQFLVYPIKKIHLRHCRLILHLKYLITIAYQSRLISNIILLIPILKMV